MLPEPPVRIFTIRTVLMVEEREYVPQLSRSYRRKDCEECHNDRASSCLDGQSLPQDIAILAIDPETMRISATVV